MTERGERRSLDPAVSQPAGATRDALSGFLQELSGVLRNWPSTARDCGGIMGALVECLSNHEPPSSRYMWSASVVANRGPMRSMPGATIIPTPIRDLTRYEVSAGTLGGLSSW